MSSIASLQEEPVPKSLDLQDLLEKESCGSLESRNGLDWKRPLKAVLSNLSAMSWDISTRPDCSEPCLA